MRWEADPDRVPWLPARPIMSRTKRWIDLDPVVLSGHLDAASLNASQNHAERLHPKRPPRHRTTPNDSIPSVLHVTEPRRTTPSQASSTSHNHAERLHPKRPPRHRTTPNDSILSVLHVTEPRRTTPSQASSTSQNHAERLHPKRPPRHRTTPNDSIPNVLLYLPPPPLPHLPPFLFQNRPGACVRRTSLRVF